MCARDTAASRLMAAFFCKTSVIFTPPGLRRTRIDCGPAAASRVFEPEPAMTRMRRHRAAIPTAARQIVLSQKR